MNDNELRELLRQWQVPPAPPSLERKLFSRRRSWWRWLLTGQIRVPVPVGLAAVLLLIGLALSALLERPAARPAPASQVNFADFQPVEELKPRIIRSAYENR